VAVWKMLDPFGILAPVAHNCPGPVLTRPSKLRKLPLMLGAD
jgi:hypothetical protein